MYSLFELSYAPYRMVFINIAVTLIVISLLAIYKLLFPLKRISYFLILLCFTIIPLISIFRPGSYESGDLTINAAKLMSFYSNLTEGNLIPRWSGELNATYGYPNFIFAYPLPYYIASFFHFLGFSFINSIKVLLIVSFIGSGISMFHWIKTKLSEEAALVGSILYLYTPYHLIDLHFRVDIGETLAFVFIPLVFIFIDKVIGNSSFIWKLLGGLSLSFLILSHQAVSLLAFPLLLGYVILHINKEDLVKTLKPLFVVSLGLLYSAYYWLPILLEGKFTQQVNQVKENIFFPNFTELLYSPYRYGFLFQGPHGELSPLLGYGSVIVIFLSFYLVLQRNFDRLFIYFLLASAICIFLMQRESQLIWNTLALLRRIEFPFRILSIFTFCISILGAITVEKINKIYITYMLIILTIGTTILNWGNRKNIPSITDSTISNNLPLQTSNGEGLFAAAPIYSTSKNIWQTTVPKSHIEAISGQIKLIDNIRRIESHNYVLDVVYDAKIKENTAFFPGWELEVDGAAKYINYSDPEFPGIIIFDLASGKHTINLVFRNTYVRSNSLLISLVSLLLSGCYLVLYSILFAKDQRLTSILLPTPAAPAAKPTT